MASLEIVLSALVAQVTAATAGLVDATGADIPVRAALNDPPERVLAEAATGQYVAIGVLDRKVGRTITAWGPRRLQVTTTPAALASSFGAQGSTAMPAFILLPGAAATLTLTGPVTPGDAVSLIAVPDSAEGDAPAVVVSCGANDTPTTVAAAMAASARANGALSALVTVSADAGCVTIVSLSSDTITLESFTGNGGSKITEVARIERQIQIKVWAGSEDWRSRVSTAIESILAQMAVYYGQFYSGLPLPNGEAAQVISGNNFNVNDAVLAGSLRRDFLFGVQYSITVTDQLYAVLVTSRSTQITP